VGVPVATAGVWLTAAVAVSAGCYDPGVPGCAVQCASGSECPEGTSCSAGWCNPPGVSGATCAGGGGDGDGGGDGIDAMPLAIDDGGRPVDDMVAVAAGAFDMGCAGPPADNGCYPDETQHEVTLSAYEIDRTEVTQAAYALCVADGACPAPLTAHWRPSDRPQWPAVGLDHAMAAAYCGWVDKRLPTEAEWERAARGTDLRVYPWGDDDPECGVHGTWATSGCLAEPASVGTYPAGATALGGDDMAGNVWEWVADWYGADYYEVSPDEDPEGPGAGTERILRGGGFLTGDARFLRVSNRNNTPPADAADTYGVRCAR
jgi:formylglycine-generating enzyme required for sulfatase activity